MNKYQKTILNNINFSFYSKDLDKDCNYVIENEELNLYQDENYNITKYNLIIDSEAISSIEVLIEAWDLIKPYNNKFNLDIDFNEQIRKIKLIFNDDIVDHIILNLNYIYANRDDYDLILKKKNDEIIYRKASIRVTTGQSLINVLFQPINDEYSYSKIELYSYMDNQPLLMARYKVSDELFFLAINNLAYGTYKIRVIEYNANDEVIFTSPFHLATLQRPRTQIMPYDR
ncbi:MAG: hypothetical protein J6Y28_00240 [Acholeplasmatales bacterium]|nr:hypothetical protein [Acholeplasmatales bacterium]